MLIDLYQAECSEQLCFIFEMFKCRSQKALILYVDEWLPILSYAWNKSAIIY